MEELEEAKQQAHTATHAFNAVRQKRFDTFMKAFSHISAGIDRIFKVACSSACFMSYRRCVYHVSFTHPLHASAQTVLTNHTLGSQVWPNSALACQLSCDASAAWLVPPTLVMTFSLKVITG